MNLDELVNSIPDSEITLRENFRKWINDWKESPKDVFDLDYLIGKWHGNVWFKNQDVANQFHENFLTFRDNAIKKIGGMTINERLYWFGLTELWDLDDEKQQDVIRIKLKANP